jgi:hypothetical protein
MLILEAPGNEILYPQLEGLGGWVAEDVGGRLVPENYPLSSSVRDDDRIPNALKKMTETQVLRTQALRSQTDGMLRYPQTVACGFAALYVLIARASSPLLVHADPRLLMIADSLAYALRTCSFVVDEAASSLHSRGCGSTPSRVIRR